MYILLIIVYAYIKIFEFFDSIKCSNCGKICNKFSTKQEKHYFGGDAAIIRYVYCERCGKIENVIRYD